MKKIFNLIKGHKKMAISGAIFLLLLFGAIFIYTNTFHEVNVKPDKNYNELFSKEQLGNFERVLPEYSTDVSIGYLNKDGTKSIYIYASPINFINSQGQLNLIDTRLTNIKDKELKKEGYVYTAESNDILPLYPKKIKTGIKLVNNDIEYTFTPKFKNNAFPVYQQKTNFIGDKKNMLTYTDSGKKYSFYPSYCGTNCEISYNGSKDATAIFELTVQEGVTLRKEPGHYLVLSEVINDTDTIVGVIQAPLVKNKSGDVSYNNKVDFTKNDDGSYEVIFTFDKNYIKSGSKVFLSFEMARNNQPDNALYSELPDLNFAYLKNFSVIGNSKEYGIGRLMVRFKFAKDLNISSGQVKDAYYYAYDLSGNKVGDTFELVSVLEDWCSIMGNWNMEYKTGDRTSLLENSGYEMKFDIKNEVMKWCDDPDGQMEHNGVEMKSTGENEKVYNILLSNDNSLYRNMTEIILK
ncbi:MAG: hypothetical protein LBI03_04000 [Clostridiales bacterium]|jgi:hypothetical protein|nr:hypothetical protein [Clostridiales bacterium]